MAVVKEGLEVSSVIVQEGVPTFESIHDAIAEPVVYMIDRFVVGGFYRVHAARGPRREPERAGRAVRAARVRVAVHSRPERAGRLRAQPLLRVRRRRPARAARGRDRGRGARRSPKKPFPPERGAAGGESAMITPEYCQVMARYNRWMNERLVRAASPRSRTTSASATAARSSDRCTARSTICSGAIGCGSAASSTSRARRRRSAPTCSTDFAELARERETTDRRDARTGRAT